MHVIGSLLPLELQPSCHVQKTFYPLGFQLIVSSNSQAVLDSADIQWNEWAESFDEPPLMLHFEISRGDAPLSRSAEFHAYDHRFAFVADANNLGICDTGTRSGTAWLTDAAVADAAYFGYHFLEAMALELIVSLHLTPFHAACVAREGRGVLLCGDSGAGKSSLSYACARRGWTFLSDDASYLLRRQVGARLVLGHPHRLRLRPDAPRLFPELAAYTPVLRGNGKIGLDLRTSALAGIQTARSAAVDRIVILHRMENGPARLTPVHPAAAQAICEPIFYWWDKRISAAQQAGFDALLEASQVFSLEYSHPDAAIDLLEA